MNQENYDQKTSASENEAERLSELYRYQILDTLPETVFDRLVRMSARHFKVPTALVTLVDKDRLWFKAKHGTDATEGARDGSFCSHAIQQNGVTIIKDTKKDPIFSTSEIVTKSNGIRFYAGAPLITKNGYKIGVLCLLDTAPHPDFSEENAKELEEISSIAMDEMELRLSEHRAQSDINSLKAAHAELEKARQQAEQITKEKSQFVATISHELRTPMNGILGMAYLLSDTPLNKIQREYIDTINYSAQNLLLLINDVLDMSKIEAGELVLEKKRFDIRTCFTQTIKLLKPLAQKKGTLLTHDIDPSIPVGIIGDQGRFAQIVTNLVGNAVKFTENGTVEAAISYDENSKTVKLSVKDDGIGIPQEKQSSIFEKYTQGDASITQKYGGTGLGLAITKHLVEMLGGTIGFNSKEKEGSTFWVTLPAFAGCDNANDIPTQPPPPINATDNCIDARDAYVLVAEDHPVNQVFLVALLKKFGFSRIDVAENGIEVMETITRNSYGYKGKPYDAIFMDCKMPEQDGYETTRAIREQEQQIGDDRRVPIIAMTANALAGDKEACFEAGMDEYISKPLQPEKVREVLSRWFMLTNYREEDQQEEDRLENLPPPMDMSRLHLVADDDQEKAVLLEIFFKLTREIINTMEEARRGDEFSEWKNAAHKLKGAASNMGMTVLEDICRQSEKASNITYSQRSALLRKLKDEVARIKAYISEASPHLLTPEA